MVLENSDRPAFKYLTVYFQCDHGKMLRMFFKMALVEKRRKRAVLGCEGKKGSSLMFRVSSFLQFLYLNPYISIYLQRSSEPNRANM